jgi:hypothetical protein
MLKLFAFLFHTILPGHWRWPIGILLSELLMTTCYSLAQAPAWQSICEVVLDAVFERFGFIPSPTFDTAHARSLSGMNRKRYVRVHSYHSSIVYALSLLSRYAPPTTTPARAAVAPGLDWEELLAAAFTLLPGFSLEGSGLDPGWAVSGRATELFFPPELIAEVVLLRACELSPFALVTGFGATLDVPIACATFRDTCNVLASHRELLASEGVTQSRRGSFERGHD